MTLSPGRAQFASACLVLLVMGCSSSPSASPSSSSTGLGDSGVEIDQANVARDPASAVSASDLDAAVAANNAFGFDLFAQTAGDGGGPNVLISPFSASIALTMAYAGAVGQTATEMASVLHANLPDGGSIFEGQNALDQALSSRAAAAFEQAQNAASLSAMPTPPQATDYQLQIANAVWGEATFAWAPGFLTTLARSYGTGVYRTDFADDPLAADTAINAWVADQTADKITDLIPPQDVTSQTAMVLVDALHVKFPWANAFSPTSTVVGSFTRADGSVVSPSFMNEAALLPYADDGQAQIVELPLYGDEEALLIALPHAGTTLASYEAGLFGGAALTIPTEPTDIMLSVPKIALSGPSFPLTTALEALGMRQAFIPGTANFTGMCPPPDGSGLYIGVVLQQTTLTMEENGLEAAAATAVTILTGAAPEQPMAIAVNRPFLIALVDVPTGAILFLGHIEDPTAE